MAEGRGRGRPRADTQPLEVRLPADLIAALDGWCSARGPHVSRQDAVKIILSERLGLQRGPS